MSYTRERDKFLVAAVREGLDLQTCRKLLRYATTLQRLAEAQCNGDYPYNGDRDRPYDAKNQLSDAELNRQRQVWDSRYTVCPKCEASGVAKSALRYSAETTDDKSVDTGNGVAVVRSRAKVCPDCRTQELVRELLDGLSWKDCEGCGGTHPLGYPGDCRDDRYRRMERVEFKPIFQGDPRGAVLLLSTPARPWTEDGRGRGLYVPARVR